MYIASGVIVPETETNTTRQAEFALLGDILAAKPPIIAEVADILPAEYIYSTDIRTMYSAALAVHASGGEVDLITVTEQLRVNGKLESVGSISALTSAMNSSTSSAFWRDHLAVVRTAAMRRAVAEIGKVMEHDSNVNDPMSVLDVAQERITGLMTGCNAETIATGPEDWMALAGRLDQEQSARGVKTGYPVLDSAVNGLQPGTYVLLAARPSMGKTAMAINIALNASRAGHKVLFLSLEQSSKAVMVRLLAAAADVQHEYVRDYRIKELSAEDQQRIADATAELAASDIAIADTVSTMADISAVCRRAVARGKADLVVIDYLGLIRLGERCESRNIEVTRISARLKALAKRLNVPVLVLSQLSRASEQQQRPPQLSDLRDSGSLEQDADVVMLLDRIAAHVRDPADHAAKDPTADLHIAKNRDGVTTHVHLRADLAHMRFMPMLPAEYAKLHPVIVSDSQIPV